MNEKVTPIDSVNHFTGRARGRGRVRYWFVGISHRFVGSRSVVLGIWS